MVGGSVEREIGWGWGEREGGGERERGRERERLCQKGRIFMTVLGKP